MIISYRDFNVFYLILYYFDCLYNNENFEIIIPDVLEDNGIIAKSTGTSGRALLLKSDKTYVDT